MGALILFVESSFTLAFATELAIFFPLTLILSMALLQPFKGAVVALQWHLGMHGFALAKEARDLAAATDDESAGDPAPAVAAPLAGGSLPA